MKNALPLLLACALATPAFAQEANADLQAKIAMCIGCHGIPGYQSSFPEVHKVPMISGQTAGYIGSALTAYRKGDRKHPTMRGIAASLSDKDIADIAQFYAQHGAGQGDAPVPETAPAPEGRVAELLQKGACASCHGANYNKPIDANTPKLAGQHADYLYAALKAYKTENNPLIGRANPVMKAQVQQFSLPELKAMAQYLGSLPGELKVVPQDRFLAAK